MSLQNSRFRALALNSMVRVDRDDIFLFPNWSVERFLFFIVFGILLLVYGFDCSWEFSFQEGSMLRLLRKALARCPLRCSRSANLFSEKHIPSYLLFQWHYFLTESKFKLIQTGLGIHQWLLKDTTRCAPTLDFQPAGDRPGSLLPANKIYLPKFE